MTDTRTYEKRSEIFGKNVRFCLEYCLEKSGQPGVIDVFALIGDENCVHHGLVLLKWPLPDDEVGYASFKFRITERGCRPRYRVRAFGRSSSFEM